MRSHKFETTSWKANEANRYRMINDIIDCKILIGKTREEVSALLGSTSEEGPCDDCMGYNTQEPDQGYSIDHQVLHIQFQNNKVTNVYINLW